MKKLFMILAAAALVFGAASCEKENFQKALAEGEEKIDYSNDPMGTIKVYIKKDDTKMDFTETDGTLSRKWKVDDVIDGTSLDSKDSKYKPFQYTVVEANYEGEQPYIVLEKTAGDTGIPSAAEGTTIHFVYAQGAVVSFNEIDGACTLDLSKQDEAHIPAVAVASGQVTIKEEDNKPSLKLDFTPVAAVLAIKATPSLKDFDETTSMMGTFEKVSVSALTKGTMEIEDGKFVLKSVAEGTATVTGVDCTKDIFAAVLPGNCTIKAKILDVKNGDTRIGSFGYEKSGVTVAADKYLRIKTEKPFIRIPVAEIGEVKYATVDDAVAAANGAIAEVTIKMLEDVEASSTINTKNEGVYKITLDLAGHTIETTASYAISNSTSELVITGDGKIKSSVEGKGVVRNYESGTLTIEGGEISGYGNDSNGVVYSYGGGTLNINGGKISTVSGIAGRAVNATATVNVSGGTISSDAGYALRVYGTATATVGGQNLVIYAKAQSPVVCVTNNGSAPTMTYSKGYVYSDSDKAPFTKSAESTLTVSGGYYNNIVIGNMEKGKACMEIDPVQDPDGRSYGYEVKDGVKYVAKVVAADYEENFTDCTEALNMALTKDESTVTILTDCGYTYDANKTVGTGKSLTIDLNGNKVSFSKYRIDVGGGTFTIKDSKTGGEYVNTSNAGYFGIQVNSGIFNLEGGTVEAQGTSAAVRAATGGEVNISGGVIKNTGSSYGINMEEGGKANITGGTVEAITSAAVRAATGGEVNISGGVIKNTGSSYGLSLAGGTGNITGGVVYSKASHTVYMGIDVATLNIHGGVFIAANVNNKDNVFPLYTTTDGKKHILNVDSKTSVPYFYGGGKNDASETKYQDRLLYVSYSTTKSVKAGYTQKHYWVNKTKDTNENGGVDKGYSVVELQNKQTFEFEGVTYEFGYQVQKNN